jgi:AraC-like DNA-binding protein
MSYIFKDVGTVKPDPQWHMRRHRHDGSNELIMVLNGKLRVVTDECELIIEGGTAVVYPSMCWHEEFSIPEDPCTTIFFEFKGDMGKLIYTVKDYSGRMGIMARWVLEDRFSSYNHAAALMDSSFEALMQEFVRCRETSGHGAFLDNMRAFMIANIDTHLTIDILARRAAMSKFHFIRTYKHLSGLTPMDDLRAVRVENAKHLLLSTELPLKRIAEQNGFANEFHFTRIFKSLTGTAPSRFRKTGHV